MGAEIIGSNPKRFQLIFDQALILNLTDGLLLQAFAVVVLGAAAEEKVHTTLATKFNPGLQRFAGCFAQGKRNRLLGLLMLIIILLLWVIVPLGSSLIRSSDYSSVDIKNREESYSVCM